MKFISFKILILSLILSFYTKTLLAQCINTFPNTQNFETAATWVAGGANSDWAWGSPSKAVITAAGSGAKCWVIGGLTGSNYNGSQQSYIQSPCYDFSTLTYPTVSFKVFWEMEYRYDGANLQYSTNNGSTWQTVGAYNDPSNCNTQNWYNYGAINYLNWTSSKNGWSGNSQATSGSCQGGNGSMGWVTSKHCLSNLAGQSNVKFRFVFGSGLTCNSFDGFAIDDFTIENAVVSPVTFTNTCTNFTSINSACQASLNYVWSFGDPFTAANNTSTLSNPSHQFSNGGIYTVSLSTSGGACGAKTTFTKTVSVLSSSISAQTNVTCKGGNNGSATVIPLYGTNNLTYVWSPEGGTAATSTSLIAGNYSVLVTDGNGCQSTSSVSITEPNVNTGVASQTIVSCVGNASILQVLTTGITSPITYLWMPGGYTTNSISVAPLITTQYSVNVTIGGACPKQEQKLFTNQIVSKPTILFTNTNPKGCAPLCVSFADNSTTAAGNITNYTWQFTNGVIDNSANPTLCFYKAGTYKVNHGVTNSVGCTNFKDTVLTITVLPTPIADFVADKNNFTDLEETLVTFTDKSTANPTQWEWNLVTLQKDTNQNSSFKFTNSGIYPIILSVTNQYGCTNTITHTITVLPEFTFYVPNTFSPNDDHVNDIFLPMGKGWEVSSYSLAIYDRWGQKLFNTQNSSQGWNGKIHGSNDAVPEGIYIYKIEVNDNQKKLHSYVGYVTVIN